MTAAQEGFVSATRARKNLEWLRKNAPQVFKGPEPEHGWESVIPAALLANAHRSLPVLTTAPLDLDELVRVKFPQAGGATLAVFSGTIFFVQITFNLTGPTPSTHLVASADVGTAIAYASLAVPRISAYCAQYGPNQLSVHPAILQFSVSLTSSVYTDADLRNWVSSISLANALPAGSSAVVILNPPEMTNTFADPSQGIGGYHDHGALPYVFVNVSGSGLTVADTANLYANALSHEIAEMTVDPKADISNPEVCDPCAGNCNNQVLNFFDSNGVYVGSASSTAPPFAHSFFIAAVARPSSAQSCPASVGDCAYPPPGWQPWGPIGIETFQPLTRVCALARDPDDVDLFAVAPDSQVYTAWWHAGQPWAGWAVVASGSFSQGTAITGLARDSSSIDLFAVGEDGKVYTAWWRGQNWSGFAQFASGSFSQGTTITGLARDSSSIDLFAVGEDGKVYTAWWRGQNWSGFAQFASGSFSQGTTITGLARDSSSIDLFAVGEDGKVYTAWWRGQNWSGFAQFASGSFSQGTTITGLARDSSSIDLFAVGEDGKVYTAWWRGQNWSGFAQFASGSFSQGTTITGLARDSSSIDLFAVGEDGKVYTAWWRGQNWSGFAPILPDGTFQQGTPVTAVARGSDAIDLYAVGQDGRVYMTRWFAPQG